MEEDENKKQASKYGFKTMAEAQASLALHVNGGPSGNEAAYMGAASDGGE